MSPVWFITGSSAGLGLALTKYALSQRHQVVATSRNPSKTPDLVEEVEKAGGLWLGLDVTWTEEKIVEVVKQAELRFGRVDIVANVAGYALMGATEDLPNDAMVAQMDANFFGPLKVIKAVLPGMRSRRSGMILNVSSAQGFCPSPANGLYAASKAALEAASESLNIEVAPLGIRVLVVELGAFRTGFAAADVAMYVAPSTDYAADDHPVRQRLEAVKKLGGLAKGDPGKAARIMFEAATGSGDTGKMIWDEKVFRLVIGPDCWKRVDEKVTELRRTTDLLRTLAASSDADT